MKVQQNMQSQLKATRVEHHALVLGPSDHVQSDSTEPVLLAQPVNIALQPDPLQKSDQS